MQFESLLKLTIPSLSAIFCDSGLRCKLKKVSLCGVRFQVWISATWHFSQLCTPSTLCGSIASCHCLSRGSDLPFEGSAIPKAMDKHTREQQTRATLKQNASFTSNGLTFQDGVTECLRHGLGRNTIWFLRMAKPCQLEPIRGIIEHNLRSSVGN